MTIEIYYWPFLVRGASLVRMLEHTKTPYKYISDKAQMATVRCQDAVIPPSPRCVHCGGSLRPARLRASRAAGVLCLWCDERRHFRATRCQGRRLPRQPVRRFLPLPLDAGNAPSRTGVSKCFAHTISHGTPVPVPVPTPLKTPPSPAGLYLGKKLGLTPPGYDDFKAIQYCSDIVDAFEGGVGKNNEDTHRGPLQAPRRTAPRHACEEDG